MMAIVWGGMVRFVGPKRSGKELTEGVEKMQWYKHTTTRGSTKNAIEADKIGCFLFFPWPSTGLTSTQMIEASGNRGFKVECNYEVWLLVMDPIVGLTMTNQTGIERI
jgi:hypothetical protein